MVSASTASRTGTSRALAVLVVALSACGEAASREDPSLSASGPVDYCELPDLSSDLIAVRPAAGDDPIDDVNWFARPVAHDGPDRLLAFASHDQNYLYNITTGVRIQIPDRSDAVATPDGRYMTVPSYYTPDSHTRFYPVAPMLERLERKENATDLEPAFIHDHPAMSQVYYQSTAVVSEETTADGIVTTYRLMFSGTGDESAFRIVDYRFTHDATSGALLGVEPSEPMRVCPAITNDLNTPFISKDGRHVIAYTSDQGGQAYSAGASLKLFEIMATNPAAGTTSCEQVLDFGFAAGKADFSFDGSMVAFHISQGGYLTPFVNGGLDAGTITDVVVARLDRDANGAITGQAGLRRVTTSLEAGVGSYFPAFFPDGSLFYIANSVPKSSEGEKRFHFRVVDPEAGPWRSGVFETSEAREGWTTIASLWEESCGSAHPVLAAAPFPFKEHEVAWVTFSLDEGQCHALVEDVRTYTASAGPSAAGVASRVDDWDALLALCGSLRTASRNAR
jgi:hypothetical protein